MNKKTTQTPVAGSETTEARHHNKLHQITKAGSTTLTHDSSGNITDDGSRLLAYDAMNRVKTITRKSDSTVLGTYTYDAFGRRIQKVTADLGGGQGGLSGNITAGTTDYLYDGIQCVEERISDSMTKQFVWGLYIDELLEIELADSSKYYPLQDLLYRTNALTDSNGSITEKYDTDVYGKTLIFDASDNPKSNPTCEFLFTGRRFDTESELYFYRARYYNPELGRFISKDPIGYMAGSLSLYEYVGSKPIKWVDPMGLEIILGFHANDSHVWVSVDDTATKLTTTYGLWRYSHVKPNSNSIKPGSDVMVNIEKRYAYSGASRYYKLTPKQQKALNKFLWFFLIFE